MEVSNQVAMDIPDIGPGSVCDHNHSGPTMGQGHQPIPTAVDVRNVYIASKLMSEFMHYAQVLPCASLFSWRGMLQSCITRCQRLSFIATGAT
jgi:hypothetical protein